MGSQALKEVRGKPGPEGVLHTGISWDPVSTGRNCGNSVRNAFRMNFAKVDHAVPLYRALLPGMHDDTGMVQRQVPPLQNTMQKIGVE